MRSGGRKFEVEVTELHLGVAIYEMAVIARALLAPQQPSCTSPSVSLPQTTGRLGSSVWFGPRPNPKCNVHISALISVPIRYVFVVVADRRNEGGARAPNGILLF